MKFSLLAILLAAALSVGCASNRHACDSCGHVGGCDVGCPGGACTDGSCGPGGCGPSGCADGSCGPAGCADGSCGLGHGGLRQAAMAHRMRQADERGPNATPGPPSATVVYPYYTTRAPRDFLLDNPPSIGR